MVESGRFLRPVSQAISSSISLPTKVCSQLVEILATTMLSLQKTPLDTPSLVFNISLRAEIKSLIACDESSSRASWLTRLKESAHSGFSFLSDSNISAIFLPSLCFLTRMATSPGLYPRFKMSGISIENLRFRNSSYLPALIFCKHDTSTSPPTAS